ncbi:hypothetical protein AGABI2DRAFT_116591 [Agaricus bisporus var. bisporus H97]|uniref:hypothetical protein n=1 Tax=Agaricus bisporus var. bisporus (strain H97 / ATCC MYA-4626 / FGSC 10389) TaxID=936046 RepID=UPI00029F5F72|nr:hypothetical protein AGABI2DRAFT_116591 [Agaricus bisporus var. bisporus H97]EKV49557.1 hypothetical protein AGABI2DRAFT_116591 [Agaricus bisporus var. bisporus H97]
MSSPFAPSPPRSLVDLPRDIWHTIADFIPEDELVNLYSVTGAWLNRSLKLRYGLIILQNWEDPDISRFLNHISTPFCAPFVRHVVVKLADMRQSESQNHPLGAPGASTVSLEILKRHTYSLLSYLLAEPIPTFDQIISLVISTMPLLTRVETLSIDCWDFRRDFDFQLLLTTAWSSFGSNLTSLIFSGDLETFRHLTVSEPSLPSLKHLEFDITVNLYDLNRDHAHELDSLENYIAPFIASFSSQLETFKLFFWPDFDLSSLFNHFPNTFRKLKHIGLRMPYRTAFQDPSGLMNFLSRTGSPSLEVLQLRLNPTGAALDRTSELPLAQFLRSLIADDRDQFTSLRSLELFPTHAPEGLTVIRTAISRSSETLTSMCIRDRSLQVDELVEVLRELEKCRGLERLRLNLPRLDIDIVQLFADTLPKLKRLSLFIDESRNVAEPSISTTLEGDLGVRNFSAWKLNDIGVWRAGSPNDTGLMQAFAHHIPSITSFWGHRHVNIDVLMREKA